MKDRVIVVTGAFGALGRAVARAAVAAGARVVALDKAAPADAADVAGAGGYAEGGADLSDAAAAGAAMKRVKDRLGRIDSLVISPARSAGRPWRRAARRPGR